MPTSYTSLLGLALPTTGELSGTWGTTVNDAITSLLDSAVAGTTTLSTDADVTLTTTDGAANQARSAVLLCSGARTAIRTLTAPAKSKGYVIINATTGGYDVKIVGVGPTTGVLVPAGTRVFVVWNGADFVRVASSTVAASDITGVLATANGGTNLSSFTTNGAMYATSTSALTTGTLPVASGGTGLATLTANNVLLGNGTAAVQVVAPGTNGNVLTASGGTWVSQAISGFVTPSANNAFTGANTFYNNTGQTFGTATSTQDGITIAGAANGSSSYRVTVVPATLTASRTLTLPDATGTVLTTATPVTVPQGGTGAATLTGVIRGNGTSAFTAATAGTDFVAPGTATNFTAPQRPSLSAETAPSANAITWNLTTTSILRINLNANITTFNLTGTLSSYAGYQYQAIVRYNGGTTITWGSSFKWPAGVAPTLTGTSGKVDVFNFVVASNDGGSTFFLLSTGYNQNL